MNNNTLSTTTKAECSIEECTGKVHGRVEGNPLCGKHYQRWWKHGDPLHKRIKHNTCTIQGCDKPVRSGYSTYCEMHYGRIRRNGTLDLLKPDELKPHTGGYVLIYAPDHPLTKRHTGPREYQHRIVFYEHHGDGPFNCHWCNKQVTWNDMHVDHVNAVRDDNTPDNLVASCPLCNQWRGQERMKRTIQRKYGTWIEFRGKRKLLSEWAEEIGISRSTLKSRIANGWTLEKALTEPRGKSGPKRKVSTITARQEEVSER